MIICHSLTLVARNGAASVSERCPACYDQIMEAGRPRGGLSRRFLLAAACGFTTSGLAKKGDDFPPERVRYPDPTTEFEVLRLTSPEYASYLPPPQLRCISQSSGFLVFTSDRAGSPQVFRMELRSGATRQLTSGAQIDSLSVGLMPGDRSLVCFDGPRLIQVGFTSLRERVVYEVPQGWTRTEGCGLTEDGLYASFAEQRDGRSRLRLVSLTKGTAATLAEAGGVMSHPMPRPRRDSVLYRLGGDLWLVHFDGKQNRRLRLAGGVTGPALWSPDGKTVLYLNYPSDPGQLHALREFTPDEQTDKLISKTSQYVNFARNANASVFLGVSRNKASPVILLMLRSVRRELTLCEHRAGDPAAVALVFAPNSQSMYFQSDRHGRSALYSMAIDRLVEKTSD